MTITIEDVVRKIKDWNNKEVKIEPLYGGLTNTNYRVDVDGTPYFVRIPGASTDLLSIDRKNEHYNSKAAAQTGVAPEVIHYLLDDEVMVLQFIDGKTMSNRELIAPDMPRRIVKAIKTLHSAPRFLTDFNMFRLTEFYLKVVKDYDIDIPEGYYERMPAVKQIEDALKVNPIPTVPCNNDLLAENYIDDGKQIWIIDYEYSGNNDPCFELGNTCQELEYDEDQIVEVCSAYFGEPYPDKLARMKLQMIMSDVGWGLWAAIQAKISAIDYDFWGWATERWGRAVEKFDSPDFPDWIKTVQQLK